MQVTGNPLPRGVEGGDHARPGGDELSPGRDHLLLGAVALGDIADKARESDGPGQAGAGDGQLRREFAAIGAHRRDLDPPVQDVRISGGQVAGETEPVLLAQRRRHDGFAQLPADQLIGRAPEDSHRAGVDVGYAGVLVDAEDAVQRRLQDRALASLDAGQVGEGDHGAAAVRRVDRSRPVLHRDHRPVLPHQPVFRVNRLPGRTRSRHKAFTGRHGGPVGTLVVERLVNRPAKQL